MPLSPRLIAGFASQWAPPEWATYSVTLFPVDGLAVAILVRRECRCTRRVEFHAAGTPSKAEVWAALDLAARDLERTHAAGPHDGGATPAGAEAEADPDDNESAPDPQLLALLRARGGDGGLAGSAR